MTTDGDAVKANELAHQLFDEFWAMRNETRAPTVGVTAAVDAALASQGIGPGRLGRWS